ncbi:MAG: hypothetical protein SO045_00345 [Campylobacter sp.]|nr:hypothetical protein [Campylobacter sp.]MDY4012413.1 hypothetical protein [Campylobacter sp.]
MAKGVKFAYSLSKGSIDLFRRSNSPAIIHPVTAFYYLYGYGLGCLVFADILY